MATQSSQPQLDTIAGSAATTATLAVGGSAAGHVNSSSDHDWFRVTLVAGTKYVFTLNANGGSALDTFLTLRNSGGVVLVSNDDGGGGTNSRIVFEATTSGTHYLDASGFGGATGSYTVAAQHWTAPPSYTLDQIATYLSEGYWGGSVSHWSQTTISFNVQGLQPAAMSLARQAFAVWQDAVNLRFVETTSAADIMLDDASTGAFANTSSRNGATASGTVNVQQNWSGESNPTLDSYTYMTFIHEIGHVLGLGHGGPYNGSADYGVDNIYANDTWAISVMSYFGQDNYNNFSYRYAMTPMLADLVALQGIYGANTTTRSGDTVYGHNSNAGALFNFSSYASAPALTIWDGSGVDTLDASGYGQSQIVNLYAEGYSSIGGLVGNIAIARGTVIETAIGGAGNDLIYGNGVDNTLGGNGGNDTVWAGTGNDWLWGGAGGDELHGDDGFDTIFGQAGADALGGESGNDTLNGGSDSDWIWGGTGDDTLHGDDGSDTLFGDAGSDSMGGESGNDSVFGGDGDDWLWGGSDHDTLNGDGDNDTLLGGDGSDALGGGAGADWLYSGAGNDWMWGGSGADLFIVAAGDGYDWIMDFSDQVDRIDLRAFGFNAGQLSSLIAGSVEWGGANLTFDLGAGQQIIVANISRASFSEADFLI